MSTAYGGDGITFPDNSVQATAPRVGMVNRIINGDMRIDQRNAGASVTQTGLNQYVTDRFLVNGSVTTKFTAQQSTVVPAGFKNSLLATSSSAYSVGSSETFTVQHRIEGFNVADLGWGTADAQAVTLSFRVRSSLTGTFGGSLRNSAADRSYPFSYTISVANTWEIKTITIAGDTTGTWLSNNGIGINLIFSMGTGSTLSGTAGSWVAANYLSATGATSVVGTSGATFYITGVQLEAGSVATPFERRPYGTELQLAQRYYYQSDILIYVGGNGSNFIDTLQHTIVPMRTTPTIVRTGNGIVTGATAGSTITGRSTVLIEAYNSAIAAGGSYTASAEL
jgi:hypothetical protein